LVQLNKVIDENASLRNSLARSPPATSVSPSAMDQIEEGRGEEGGEGEGVIPLYAQVDKSKKTSRTSGTLSSVPASPSPTPSSGVPHSARSHSARSHSKSSVSSTEGVVTTPPGSTHLDTPTTTAQQDTLVNDSAFDEEGGRVTSNPAMEIVHLHIKSITQCIQELLQAAQAHRQTSFRPCSAKITKAVDTMVKLFPAVSLGNFLTSSVLVFCIWEYP
jgi:hypothetical protein